MKIIVTDNEIVSLENVIRVSRVVSGSGAKSNPYSYRLDIEYINGTEINLFFKENKIKCNNIFEKIATLLEE